MGSGSAVDRLRRCSRREDDFVGDGFRARDECEAVVVGEEGRKAEQQIAELGHALEGAAPPFDGVDVEGGVALGDLEARHLAVRQRAQHVVLDVLERHRGREMALGQPLDLVRVEEEDHVLPPPPAPPRAHLRHRAHEPQSLLLLLLLRASVPRARRSEVQRLRSEWRRHPVDRAPSLDHLVPEIHSAHLLIALELQLPHLPHLPHPSLLQFHARHLCLLPRSLAPQSSARATLITECCPCPLSSLLLQSNRSFCWRCGVLGQCHRSHGHWKFEDRSYEN
ncbi:hypothetical protein MPTK1_7g04550 [Marchantia polymorpha subsp. ruderalis]|uniref:Uncharacterized protein n=1 Tax=Marchantia polymorpha subsp. ruderalis TaxID=1480154 RepID=A0AAF6BW45_MARPO|nr:hypothetical protein Mp_7g04550 [Marchantia polymorpha subsp. ruderalis]